VAKNGTLKILFVLSRHLHYDLTHLMTFYLGELFSLTSYEEQFLADTSKKKVSIK
jgi:hypothetical protein